MEKQRDKAAKKLQRKADKAAGIVTPDDDSLELLEPLDADDSGESEAAAGPDVEKQDS